jgi:hypothetical protein
VRLSDTRFVACYKQQVWEVRQCPTDLRFDPLSQTCVPATKSVSLVPRGPYTPPPANSTTPAVFLYAWSGNDNPGPNCKDALVVVDATPESPTFVAASLLIELGLMVARDWMEQSPLDCEDERQMNRTFKRTSGIAR